MFRLLSGSALLAACALVLTAARPAPEPPKERVDISPYAVAANLGLGSGAFLPGAEAILLLPVDPDGPPRVCVKLATGALADETGQWLMDPRPAGVNLSLPLPETRESLPAILPDDE